ncbi:Zn-dependent exopeptidase [Lactifluus subvellereus]|nr:Zn-dependent exopeptidase [Lactifluus subvellereus]
MQSDPFLTLPPVLRSHRHHSNKASLSRDLRAATPSLVHTLIQEKNSILSVATDENHIYSGSQSQNISVWDNRTYTLQTQLRGHTGSVLSLEYTPDKRWLFSYSGMFHEIPAVWCTKGLTPLYVINPFLDTDSGDLFSLAWSPTHSTIYIGCQNTSIQWYNFTNFNVHVEGSPATPGTSTPRRAHKFFDSYPRSQRRSPDLEASNGISTPIRSVDGHVVLTNPPTPRAELYIPPQNVIDSAHYGYVYCVALLPSTREGVTQSMREDILLATGSGDETVKVWKCFPNGLELLSSIECTHGAILSLVTREDIIYAGCQDGYVRVWDLQTNTFIRTIMVQENVDILSLSILGSDLYVCSADGQVKRYLDTFDCTASWSAHSGIVLLSIVTRGADPAGFELITGGNDGAINIWKVHLATVDPSSGEILDAEGHNTYILIYALSKFVSIRSVSSSEDYREDCRQAAIWLTKCVYIRSIISRHISNNGSNSLHNPIVFACFQGAQTSLRKPRILFYGHYDVISAPPEGWVSDPFRLTARNGYLYGRGVADDKGPVLAVACAAADLVRARKLGVDLLFLVEGEEKTGSGGFVDAVLRHKARGNAPATSFPDRNLIGDVDAILVSNSSWIASNVPSITYGLCGVVHCDIEISSRGIKDSHSGIDGGAWDEPMQDMIQVLAGLTDSNRRVLIPGFYDKVRPQDAEEATLFRLLGAVTQRSAASLNARWREPALTIHSVRGSGPHNPTVIPASVTAQVSLRIVPDQVLDAVCVALVQHLRELFDALRSSNIIKVNVDHTADWWLGDLTHPWFLELERAIHDEWGTEPMRVREGGSIPCVPFLEKAFGCPALHLPMGESSGQAHLPNENISLSNLRHGKAVVERFLLAIADSGVVPKVRKSEAQTTPIVG